MKLARSMTLNLYIDDGSLGGDVNCLLHVVLYVVSDLPSDWYVLNDANCEITTNDDNVVASIRTAMPNIRHIPLAGDAIMLRPPVAGESSVDMVLKNKLAAFRRPAPSWPPV